MEDGTKYSTPTIQSAKFGVLSAEGPSTGSGQAPFDKLRAGAFDRLRAGAFDKLRRYSE
jgi:hypothetical protein